VPRIRVFGIGWNAFCPFPHVHVREWYEPVARQWSNEAATTLGEIRLVVDGTKVGIGHQLLIVCLAFRRRAVPWA
jgi:hypothetical protein